MMRRNPMRTRWNCLLGLLLCPVLASAQSSAPVEARTPVIVSPRAIASDDSRIKVFLAGSIDMGGSEDWQAKAIRELSGDGVVLLNPRRADWNRAWKPSADEPEFHRQVQWEPCLVPNAEEDTHPTALVKAAHPLQTQLQVIMCGNHRRSTA